MTYPSAPVDAATQDTLNLMHADRVHRTDRDIIIDAIETVAARNGGTVDPNELRRMIDGLVYPKTIGSTINGLARSGRLTMTGWTITTGSATGNDGKPARVYYLNPQTPSGKSQPRSPAASEAGAPGGGSSTSSAPPRPAAPH